MVKKSILAKVGDKINYKLIRDGYKTAKGNVVVTAEMDTKTTIVADVPSTTYTSNLDYEVDISGENPPIINIKNDITCPDDTVISKGKYFYYNLLGSEDYYKFSKEKADKIGIFNDNDSKYYDINSNLSFTNLSHQNGIISGFSRSNYATFGVSSYEVGGGFVIYFRTGSDNAQQGQIFYTGLETGLLIDTNFTCGRFGFTPTTVAQPNTNYYCKMTYQSSGKGLYQIYNENGDLLCTGNGIDASSSYSISLGSLYQYYSQAFKGSIDLIKSYIFKADGTKTYFCDYGYNVQGIKDPKLQDTGTELTTKLFDYHYNIPSTYKYNVFKNGDVIIDDNQVASNLTTSDYLTTKNVNFGTSDYEIVIKFLYNKKSSDYSVMFIGDNDSIPYVNIATTASSSGYFYLHSNVYDGSWGEGITGTHQLQLNQTYTVKVERKNNIRKIYVLINDNWVEDGSIEDNHSYSGIYRMGTSYSSQSFTNSKIYLKDSYIKIGNENKQYFAYYSTEENKSEFVIDSSKPTSIPNVLMSYSEFIDNITIPAHALFEYVNGEWKLSGTSPVITQDVTVNADNAEIAMKEIIE